MLKVKEIKINGSCIELNHPNLVIVEIGINHNVSIKKACKMVDASKELGAESIKHQTHVIEDEMIAEAKKVIPGNTDISIYDVMDRCALDEQDEIKLKKYVETKGMIFLSTPFSKVAADRLERMGVFADKFGSGYCDIFTLVEHIASFGKLMIVSTGMNDIISVRKMVNILYNPCTSLSRV